MTNRDGYFKEYYEENKETILEKRKKYYEQSLEKITKRKKDYYKNNREKTLLQKKQYCTTHKKEKRIYELKKRYGLSFEEYELIKQRQQGKCAICGIELCNAKECVDHDHKTGVVRGVLCDGCNSAIGRLKDDYRLVEAAHTYLLIDGLGLIVTGHA